MKKYQFKTKNELHHAAAIEKFPEQHNPVIPSDGRLVCSRCLNIRRRYFCIENQIIDVLKGCNGQEGLI